MTVATVVRGVVVQIRTKQDHYESRRHNAVAEMTLQQPAKDPQARYCPGKTRQADGVLVIQRESVRGQVGPVRQRMGDNEERRLHERDTDRVRVDPLPGA